MRTPFSSVQGTLFTSLTREDLAVLLTDCGMEVSFGAYVLRLFDGRLELDPDGYDTSYEVDGVSNGLSVEDVAGWCRQIVGCLHPHGVRYSLTHHDEKQNEVCTYVWDAA